MNINVNTNITKPRYLDYIFVCTGIRSNGNKCVPALHMMAISANPRVTSIFILFQSLRFLVLALDLSLCRVLSLM